MSTLRIIPDAGRTAYEPGEPITGRIEWSLDASTSGGWLELRLLWHTEGKGTRDGNVVETLRINAPAATGEQDFAFTLPGGPYSFAGRLISLLWGLELVSSHKGEAERVELTVAPGGKAVQLGTVEK